MKAVFLDRDGTIIQDRHYLLSPEGIRFLKGAFEGLKILKKSGFKIFIVTNQSGVGRGFLSLPRLNEINKEILLRLKAQGLYVNGVYFCPHHPKENCTCRKPKPRLVLRILKEYPEIEPRRSVTVGDKESDVLFGKILGTKNVLISKENEVSTEADFVARDLKEAAIRILREK